MAGNEIVPDRIPMSLPRLVPKDKPSLNTGKVYTNLEDEIRVAINAFGGQLPVTLFTKEIDDPNTIRYDRIVGYIVDFNDWYVQMLLTSLGADMLMHDRLYKTAVQFHYMVEDSETSTAIVKVTQASLVDIGQNTTEIKEENKNE
ncbi:hypothetical protein [uncultured Duncaniella sp.]|uniref:hypothetical protein n=1 Tax=uncultured Duncaniella sp. TaxID=2768039 RepID=UPI00262605DF|nr:hypothetical protein [uncultured Duncaniella sp.]